MSRKVWTKGWSLDDLLCQHFHPHTRIVPIGGFGDMRLLECEHSKLAVFAITGMTVREHDDAYVRSVLGETSPDAPEPPPAG